jgi:hypothetical protein
MPLTTIVIEKSNKPDKKLMATVGNKKIHFGNSSYEDYTIHKDIKRKENYISRHAKREDYTKQGIDTAGYYAKYVLWNKPTIQASIKDLNKKYTDIKFKLKQ